MAPLALQITQICMAQGQYCSWTTKLSQALVVTGGMGLSYGLTSYKENNYIFNLILSTNLIFEVLSSEDCVLYTGKNRQRKMPRFHVWEGSLESKVL